MSWIGEAPVVAIHLAGKHRAGLVSVAAHGDNGVDLLAQKFAQVLRGVGGDIDADFEHDFDGFGMNVAGGVRSGAMNIEEVARHVAQDAFGEMAAAGVASAEDEDGGFVEHVEWGSIFALTYIVNGLCSFAMKLVRIYQCLCDETRLRVLNLLAQRPLCVCHLQEILDRTQVQVSQHLARMKKDGLVESRRHQNWMIYSLPATIPPTLESHLKCLQDCVQSEPVFRKDLAALKKVKTDCGWIDEVVETRGKRCCSQ